MEEQEKIISFLKINGPVLPVQVAKFINSNILLASVHLAELSSQGKIKVSSLKIGGSPLYYLPEHKEKLLNFIHNLNPKDQQTVNRLKEKKILREKSLDLLSRVSLRNIKDFAVPLNITWDRQNELFWRWSLLSEEEAMALVKEQLAPPAPLPLPPKPEVKEVKRELLPETQGEQKVGVKEEQQTLAKERLKKAERKPKPARKKEEGSQFLSQIEAFFKERNIVMETKETLRKNSEINFIIKVPSVVGKITYFGKAKNKRRCDEKDLSVAYMEAQGKKLPLLFIYTSELSKKAQEMLDAGALENAVVKKIG